MKRVLVVALFAIMGFVAIAAAQGVKAPEAAKPMATPAATAASPSQ